MSDIKSIQANFKPIADVGKQTPRPSQSFGDVLSSALDNTMQTQKTAESMSTAVAMGENIPMHEVTQAISKAEMTLQTLMGVRDRAVEAYKEIMQMPI